MKTCDECGLPIPVCNALTMYREAAKYTRLGRLDEAARSMESAAEYYQDYIDRRRPEQTVRK